MQFFLKKMAILFVSLFLIQNRIYASELSHVVLVSVAPHKFFVEKIAGNTVQVYLMVPAGASSHTYEPTPKQMLTAATADIWFRIGESFENRAIQALTNHRPFLQIIDLRTGIDLIQSGCHCCPGSVDLHFWLSARQAQIQAKEIAKALIKVYPEHTALYESNLLLFQKELEELDHTIEKILTSLKQRVVLVSHPAYGYFCRDYQMQQLAIEVEGKDPTPQQVTRLLSTIKQQGISSIFIQMQYNNKAARLISENVGASLITLDPYSEDYFKAMLEIAHAFARQ